MKKIKTLLLILPLAISAQAAVVITDSGTATKTAWTSGTQTFTSGDFSFSLTGVDKLVVTFGINHSSVDPSRVVNSVSYNGQAMTEAVGLGGDSTSFQSAIYYLDNPGTTLGDLVLSTTNGYGMGVTIMGLSGTALGHGATGGTESSSSTSLTTTASNSFVIASILAPGEVGNGLTVPAAQSSFSAGPGTLIDYSSALDSAIGTGYQTIASSGTNLTPTFYIGATTFDIAATTVAAEFLAAIPEPSTTLLLGVLGSMLLLRRRR